MWMIWSLLPSSSILHNNLVKFGEVAEDQKHGCNTSDEVTEPIRCCNQSPKLIPVWTEHAISFIVSCIWTLDPQLVALFGKALVTWKGRASLEVLGHCGKALRASISTLLLVYSMPPASRYDEISQASSSYHHIFPFMMDWNCKSK